MTTVDAVQESASRSAVVESLAPGTGRHTLQAQCGSAATAEHDAFSSAFSTYLLKVQATSAALSDATTVAVRGPRKRPFTCYLDAWEGRWYICYQEQSGNERCQLRYRFFMECFLNRKLERSEVIHHKNHNKTDDRIENLELTNNRDHILKHAEEAREAGGKPWGKNNLPTNDRPDGMRYCSRCDKTKPQSEFRKRNPREQAGTYQSYCKKCQDRASNAYRPPGYWKNYRLQRKLREESIATLGASKGGGVT